MLGLLEVLLVLVLQLDVVLHLVLDLLVLLREGAFQVVDAVLLLVEVVADPRVLLLVVLELFLQVQVLLGHLVDEGLDFEDLAVDFAESALVVADGLAELLDFVDHFVLLRAQPVVLVEQFLVVVVQRGALLLQLLDLDEFAVQPLLEFGLLLLHLPHLVGDVAQLRPQHLHLLLQLVHRLHRQFQLQLAFLVGLGLRGGRSTVSAERSLVFSMSSTR